MQQNNNSNGGGSTGSGGDDALSMQQVQRMQHPLRSGQLGMPRVAGIGSLQQQVLGSAQQQAGLAQSQCTQPL